MNNKIKIFLHKLTHKEYWPSFIFYGPLFPAWIYYSIKSRSLIFLSAANPGIEYSGIFLERKSKIHETLPPAFTPKTALITPDKMNIDDVMTIVENKNIGFPLFTKPDVGDKGIGVKKIKNTEELDAYHQSKTVPYLIQELISYEKEAGIFFVRMPNEKQGIISGIVYKELPHVFGNGKSSVKTLAFSKMRYVMQKESIETLSPELLNYIPPAGEKVELLSYGNHARGAKFYDYTFKNSPALERTINKVCCAIPGFYYGRLDIKFNTWEEFAQGEKFAIVELNGSGADPTHIFDPQLSLPGVWKIILRHWNALYKISSYLHKYENTPYMGLLEFFKLRKKYKAYLQTIS